MILVTQAAYFLNQQLMHTLNQHNFNYLVAVDEPSQRSLLSSALRTHHWLDSTELLDWLDKNKSEVEFFFHLDDDESPDDLFRVLWKYGAAHQIPLIFSTTPSRTAWVKQQSLAPFFWAGLSLANVFGPGDEGWVPQAYQSIIEGQSASNPSSAAQRMVYSLDVAAVCYFLLHHRVHSGMYTLDDVTTVTFEQVANWVERASKNETYAERQSAPPSALQAIGFNQPLFSAEMGVYDYVQNHLRGQTSYRK